jgi:hypothetical protein
LENKSHTPLAVYTITEREKDGKKFWVRLGTAFRNRDGSLNATLDGMPTNGTLHIRELRPNEHPRDGGPAREGGPPRENGSRGDNPRREAGPSSRRGYTEPHFD